MFLRQSKKVDYVKLNSDGKTDIMADIKDKVEEIPEEILDTESEKKEAEDVFQESFSDPMDTKRAEIKDLEAEAEVLELEEKAAKLRLKVKERKAAISLLENQAKTVHFSSAQPPEHKSEPSTSITQQATGTNQASRTPGDINLGELYSRSSQDSAPLKKLDIPYLDIYKQLDSAKDYQGYKPPPEQETQPYGGATMRLDLNPQSYLYSPDDPQRGKHRAIVDFIPTTARKSSEETAVAEHEIVPGLTLTTGRQTKLESVTPAQWVAGNACILADIIRKSPGTNIEQLTCDYMSYTTKIGELACKFTWKSVILYDNEYREKQHLFQFRWGCDSSHLHTVQLVPRKREEEEKKWKRGNFTGKVERGEHPSKDYSKSTPLCWNWNKETPCTHSPCNYQHVCEWCKSTAHPKVKHDAAVKTP